ncbi:MAG: orotidine-5'-phosphate decarboxylase [Micavibrio aeruginosavorus]|nr:orotidine-5'-phosphate decarboxylase [Micavibrio aeruginosavorus]
MSVSLPLIFCAIDTPDMNAARHLAAAMQEAGCGIKLGLEFFNANGPQGISAIRNTHPELPLFLDLKCHDIPNTVGGAVRAVASLAPAYLTLHASGGATMMRTAQDAANEEALRLGIAPMALLGVTVLTSLDDAALGAIGQVPPVERQVLRLAKLAQDSGLAGIVCSGHDIAPVRKDIGGDLVLMVPGIRPAGSAAQDQKRIMTPQEALRSGATHLVIGRPITEAADPGAAAAAILAGQNVVNTAPVKNKYI